jgi:hypothetical protein
MYIKQKEWMDIIQREYLQSFIKHGGAAVKFIVPIENVDQDQFTTQLHKASEDKNYLFANINGAKTKIHMIDKLFNAIAGKIDWDELARSFVIEMFTKRGYKLPSQQEDFDFKGIAEINNQEEMLLRREVHSWLRDNLFRDFEMSQEFRIAMIRLCLNQLDAAEPSGFLSNAVKEWLCGELREISTLKEALIFQKIARHNARHMLFSLIHWLRINRKSGLILLLDISRYLVPKKSQNPDDGFFYSLPAVLDLYEVLRQFIDGTDEMAGCLIVVLAPKDFLNDDKRGLNRYEALKLRIWDEVRDRQRPNPLASLVRMVNDDN